MSDLHIAKQPFAVVRDGVRTLVRPGDVVEDGHWLLDVRPDAFKPLEVTYAAPQAKPKPAKTSAAA